MTFQVGTVGSWTHVKAVNPRVADYFNKVSVSRLVLRKHYEMVATLVLFAFLLLLWTVLCHIHLTAEDGLEGFQSFLLAFLVHSVHIVVKLLYAIHVAVVGDGHAALAVGYSLVNQTLNLRLAVKNRIISMNVQVYKVFHLVLFLFRFERQSYCFLSTSPNKKRRKITLCQ